MEIKKYLLCLLGLIFLACNNDYCHNDYGEIKNLNVFLEKETKNRYIIRNGMIIDKYYELKNREEYIEVPALNNGFFLYYEDPYDDEDISAYPTLDWQGRFEVADKLPIDNITEVYLYNDYFILIKRLGDDSYTKIVVSNNYSDILIEKNIQKIPKDKLESKIHILPIKESIERLNLILYVYALEDTTKPLYQPYSTPIINGIIKVGIHKSIDKVYLFGETIYSFFILDTRTGIFRFYDQETFFKTLTRIKNNTVFDMIAINYELISFEKKIKKKKNVSNKIFKVITY